MRAGTLVTVRLGSSRLPRKALIEIAGEPVLKRLLARVRSAARPEVVVVCTTAESEDDDLEAAARSWGAEVFRGSTEDILDRWLGAARAYGLDLVVTCDGDDVLVDPVHIDRIVECFDETGADYISVEGLPFGTAPTGISTEGLARVVAAKTETNTEGQGRFFADERLVRRATLQAPDSVRHDEARMTLDYPEDLEFFSAVIDELDEPYALADVVALLRERPDIVAINSGRQAEYWERFHARYPPVELS
jgi:spore coat polysaccharide biosynthesis protein SpsF